MKQHLRGVLWPRSPIISPDGKNTNYRYVIVGMLVTDEPISLPDDYENESIIDGPVHNMAQDLEAVNKREPKFPTGTADSVLVSLEII